jgi:hypothetical protein
VVFGALGSLCSLTLASCGSAPPSHARVPLDPVSSSLFVLEVDGVPGLEVSVAAGPSWAISISNKGITNETVHIATDECRFESEVSEPCRVATSLGDSELPWGQTKVLTVRAPSKLMSDASMVLGFRDSKSSFRWIGSIRTKGPALPDISPTTNNGGGHVPAGGCKVGCPCGNSCIDCSKTCHGGSTYRRRKR